MKKLILLGFSIVLFAACNQQTKRYTQQSNEIDTYKQVIKDYENQNWESMATHYTDTAKILNNVTEKNAQTVAQLVSQNKQDATIFSSWNFVPEESEYEMVVTDKGETWVNFWGTWKCTLAANNKEIEIPVHLTAQFIDGKIVREYGYWDNGPIILAIQEIEAAAKMAAASFSDE